MEKDNTKPKLSRESLREALKILEFVRPYRWQFVFGLLLLFLSSGIFMVFPYIIGKMLDVAQGVAVSFDLGSMGLWLIGILIVQGIFSYLRVMMFAIVSEKGTADVRKALYQRLISLPIVFFEKSRVGELVSRLTNDVEKLYNTFYFILAEFIRQVIILIVGIAMLVWMSAKLAGVMLLSFPLIVIGAMIFGRWVRKLSRRRQEILGETNTILDETLQSIHAVKAFTNETFERLRYGRSNDEVVKVSMQYARGRAVFAVFIITMLFGALFFVIGYGMYMVQAHTGLPPGPDKFTAGKLITFVTYTAIMGAAIAGLGNFYAELVGAVGATERVREILRSPTEFESRPQTNHPAGRLTGDVEFRNVHFSYPTRSDVEVLKGVTLVIPSGKKVALVGQSGAGKSTFMQLLLQFHRLDAGEIRIDGTSIYAYDLPSYRQNFAIVPQEVILFGGTIRENILYGLPGASEQQVIEAARKANALEFIQKFPDGFETVVGERGIKLSGGQRQRIAIARAILRNPSILLLDEATSSLDAESEKVVQEALNNLMEGRTSIIIAHRLATVREVDCIYVLEGGQIVEEGTHENLSAMENGVYSSLAKLQFDLV
ncbi:MAG: ATP-binding cassette domain-containing protein [Saprospirales bacterium]|jgi:ATP-binding cassette subfamily B protein|nr:ATP-binding cassette domain-containing protein [Saprospirales bacterium]MBK8922210.1 ATP-binding cassette domain-containing protein [Saprospirales bacterium]